MVSSEIVRLLNVVVENQNVLIGKEHAIIQQLEKSNTLLKELTKKLYKPRTFNLYNKNMKRMSQQNIFIWYYTFRLESSFYLIPGMYNNNEFVQGIAFSGANYLPLFKKSREGPQQSLKFEFFLCSSRVILPKMYEVLGFRLKSIGFRLRTNDIPS